MKKLSSLPNWAKIGGGLFLGTFLLAGMFFYAQNQFDPIPASANAGNNLDLSNLQAKVGGDLEYSLDKTTKRVNFITTGDRNLPVSMKPSANLNSGSVADQFMAEYGKYFGLNNPAQELAKIDEQADELGSHVLLNQKYADVPVFGGQVIVHLSKDLAVTSANGRVVPNILIDTKPKISKEEAISKAKELWKNQFKLDSAEVRKSNLYVFNKGLIENKPDGENYLVWQVDLFNVNPQAHEYYYIDAHTGNLIYQITGMQRAVNRNTYSCSHWGYYGNVFNPEVLPGCVINDFWGAFFGDPQHGRSEGQSAVIMTDVNNLYNYTGGAHNYYASKFSRNGANNQGGMGDGSANYPYANTVSFAYIDYVPSASEGGACPNAYFNSANSIHFCAGYASSDITGHEYAHAVNYFTIRSGAGSPAGLTYQGESGALNESNSDVFGEAFENYYEGSNNWEIGEDLSGGASRSMANPPKYNYNLGSGSTPYPDRFHSSNYYCGTQDQGGVHINSSVPNKAAYLMAMGGTFNGCTVSGIGRTKEEAIFYRAQTNYYTTSTDFNGAYNALISACGDLYGSSSSECAATRKALQMVEMDQGGACSGQARVAPTCADATDPSISSQSPASGAGVIAKDSNISFKIDDSASGVDSSTLSVTVGGKAAISGGSLQSGYSGSVSSDSSGGYDVTINPNSDFSYGQTVTVAVSAEDNNGNSISSTWSFTVINIDPKILTTSGPGEVTRLQAYDRRGNKVGSEIGSLFPTGYTGGAGIVPIDQSNNGVRDQFLIFAASNGGPQARVMGLREDGSTVLKGQMFVFQAPGDSGTTSSIRDGLSMTVGDFDNDGFDDDAAACLIGDYGPHVKVFKDATGLDNWELINQFDAPFGAVGCNLGTFQYDTGAPEILVTPHHGPADPKVYIYTAGGTLKKEFSAYGAGVTNGLTPSGIEDRIYTTPNNGSSQINAFDKAGERKNFWWAYAEHVRGDFKNVPGDIDLDGKNEILISPIGANGPQVLAFEASGKWRTWPNFFAFGDETLRNGVGIAVVDNFHGEN